MHWRLYVRRTGTPHAALASLPDSAESTAWAIHRGPEHDKRKGPHVCPNLEEQSALRLGVTSLLDSMSELPVYLDETFVQAARTWWIGRTSDWRGSERERERQRCSRAAITVPRACCSEMRSATRIVLALLVDTGEPSVKKKYLIRSCNNPTLTISHELYLVVAQVLAFKLLF